MTVPGRLETAPFPHILNPVGYKDTVELYNSASGKLKEGVSGGGYRQRNGIAITVTIPPSLRAFRYPNLVNSNVGTPYVSNTDRATISERNEWYKAVKANSANISKMITQTRRAIKALENRIAAAKKRKPVNTALIERLEARVKVLRKDLADLKQDSAARALNTYSTEFEISDFVKSLSWSSTAENSFVEVSIGLDNLQGIFNYLPEAAKVTIWRRKSTTNINGLFGAGAGKWYRYITCYVVGKSRSASGREQSLEITCRDRLGMAQAQEITGKKWAKDKAHKKGWSPKAITIDICKKAGLPYNASKLPTRLPFYKKVTLVPAVKNKKGVVVRPATQVWVQQWVNLPLVTSYEPGDEDLIALLSGAWNRSLEKLPKKQQLPYNMHMRRGVLEVEFISPPGDPLTQKPDGGPRLVAMFNDDENIESSNLEESIDPESVYTVIKASGTYWKTTKNKKGKRVKTKKKDTITLEPSGDRGKMIIAAYGKRVKVHKFGKKQIFSNKGEFKEAAQAEIDKISRPVRKLSIEGRGPLGIWPWYYINIGSRYLGVKGNVAVESVNYSIEEGNIKISLELQAEMKHYSKGEKFYAKYPPLEKDRWY
jgi:hypothetical protein